MDATLGARRNRIINEIVGSSYCIAKRLDRMVKGFDAEVWLHFAMKMAHMAGDQKKIQS